MNTCIAELDIPPTVLIVDDDDKIRQLHQLMLQEEGFEVLCVASGEAAIAELEKTHQQYDLILSDIVMPNMDGYAFCHYLKSNTDLSDIPVIFISSLVSLEETIKGYECGADDYIAKPIQPTVLSHKIAHLLKIRTEKNDLNQKFVDSQVATMQIMKFYGDLGHILEFYKQGTGVRTLHELSDLLFGITTSFELECAIQYYLSDKTQSFGDRSAISPLESNVMTLSRKKERFYSFGKRLIINYQDFTLLIKNMPTSAPERMGTLRDTLGVLCNAIESKVTSLLVEEMNTKKNDIAGVVQEVLEETQSTFSEIEKTNTESIESMMNKIEESFFALGLSDEQESGIRQIVETCVSETNNSFKKSAVVNELFDNINQYLREMVETKLR